MAKKRFQTLLHREQEAAIVLADQHVFIGSADL